MAERAFRGKEDGVKFVGESQLGEAVEGGATWGATRGCGASRGGPGLASGFEDFREFVGSFPLSELPEASPP